MLDKKKGTLAVLVKLETIDWWVIPRQINQISESAPMTDSDNFEKIHALSSSQKKLLYTDF